MIETTEEQLPKKIIIMGLDNSGKTSIMLSLKDDTNLLSYFSIRPTKGINIEEFKYDATSMVIWEFGGQKQYREEYLKDENYRNYFNEVEGIIYVIDIQDLERYDIAFEYFEKLIDFLKKNDFKVDLWIYLHKCDPNLAKQEKYKDIDKIVVSKLLNRIKEIVPNDFKCKFFKTTIYTIFEKFLLMEL
ncbi:MAG: ADP-ribosylation factor-like protein [Candidatus Hermodarchaeota archaeon]